MGNLRPKENRPIRLPILLIAASTMLLSSLDLPLRGPVPEPRPDLPGTSSKGAAREEPGGGKPEDAKPAGDMMERKPVVDVPPPIEKEDPKTFAACTAELKAMGADFGEVRRIDDGDGCGIDRPLQVRTLGSGVALEPPGTLRCRTAVNLARWTRDVVAPMLRKARPAETLATIDQASAYVCRKRNQAESGKLSEHARGTAIDIAGFTFRSGAAFSIAPREEDSTLNGAFQRAIASAACLYFSTVLDPGSDQAHETHLHLDTLKRKGGYRYCW